MQELIDRTGCSASTIRRDLSKLQQLGKLQRIHGGAMLKENRMVEANLTEKLTTNLDEKKKRLLSWQQLKSMITNVYLLMLVQLR